MGEIIGDRLQGLDAEVFKVLVRNSDTNRGKSGGYRVIYWLKLPSPVQPSKCYSNAPLIMDRTNFFLEFDVCFYRSRSEFKIKLKP
jgi:hypothetical protein